MHNSDNQARNAEPQPHYSTEQEKVENLKTDSLQQDNSWQKTADQPLRTSSSHNRIESEPSQYGYTTIGTEEENSTEETVTLGIFIRETLQVILPALALAVIIHLFLAQATVVYGSSMQPVLREKQRLVVDKLTYRFRDPARNDIIVLDLEAVDEMLVKRVIGLPGETVDVRGGNIYIDNKPLREQLPHELSLPPLFPHPIELGQSEYYVLGDNRSNSNDSRAFGSVQRSEVVGKIWLRYWPLTEFKLF